MSGQQKTTGAAKKPPRNHIAEWFGHRIYPVVAETGEALRDQRSKRCPFLSNATGKAHRCIKSKESLGVCTVSTTGTTQRQDWLVCPYRALEPNLLDNAAVRLFGYDSNAPIMLIPAPQLGDEGRVREFRDAAKSGVHCVVYFQNNLGGEIKLPRTDRSPEFLFDSTMVEVLPADGDMLKLGRYGVFEIQTMDFHGSYSKAVTNLESALDLHEADFSGAVRDNPKWAGEKISTPNIANVFKRTFYQMMFKFQIGAHGQSAGCVFALPAAVWDSWQPHLGKPDLVEAEDGTFRLVGLNSEEREQPSSWIYVFEIQESDTVSPNNIDLIKVIGTDAATLSHYALDVAPEAALAEGGSADRILEILRLRLGEYLPEFAAPKKPRASRRPRKGAQPAGMDELPGIGT